MPGVHGGVPDAPELRAAREMMFVIPGDADGVGVERTWDAMGMRATGAETLVLEDVFVPEADLVAREFRGPLFANLEWQTVTFASVYLGQTLEYLGRAELGLLDPVPD